MKKVYIYTDGACKGNPGPGGWGAILVYEGREREISGGEARTTNNRMELLAAIEALSLLKEPCEVTLTTDSQYLVNSVTKSWLEGWRKNGYRRRNETVPNSDLWERLWQLINIHKVEFIWIKGHAGHQYNERCDRLAVKYAESFQSKH